MRMIKFRAWDNINKKMVYGPTELRFNEFTHEPTLVGFMSCTLTDNFTIQQFTGLLDKNGEEIYEGDWVRYYDSSGVWLESKVLWVGGCYAVTTDENPIPLYDFHNYYIYEGQPIEEIEVIGNIFETLPLVK